jgi:hypothetical protein
MPQQLIYTSAARGLVAGRSGYCTVARSAGMREALALRLEQLSYYQHLSLTGGQERPISAYRVVDIRGSRFHVLSRIQDAGLDYSGRTNFIAHHLVLAPEELRLLPPPAVILRDWTGWVTAWSKDPQQLVNEDWGNLASLAEASALPAQTWQRLTGDAANGYGLLEVKPGICLTIDGISEKEALTLLAESTELLELRDARRNFKTAAWQYTFTTSMQEQDNPADFRWRLAYSDSPGSVRIAGATCLPLSSLRASRVTDEERSFAQKGRQAPTTVEITPDRSTITEGETVRLEGKADGIPYPTFRWFEIEHGKPVELAGRSGPVLQEQPTGRSKRYMVQAENRAGWKDSRVVELSIKPPLSLASTESLLVEPKTATPGVVHIRTEEDMQADCLRWRAKHDQQRANGSRKARTTLFIAVSVGSFLVGSFLLVCAIAHYIPQSDSKGIALSHNATNRQHGGILAALSSLFSWPQKPLTNQPPETRQHPSLTNAVTNVVIPPSMIPQQKGVKPDPELSLPPGWASLSVGLVQGKTNACYMAPAFVLTGSGNGLLVGGDSFFFVYTSNSDPGDKDCPYRLNDGTQQPPGSCSGIMLRASKTPDAPFVFIGASFNKIVYSYRVSGSAVKTHEFPRPRVKNAAWDFWLLPSPSSRDSVEIHYKYSKDKDWCWLTPPAIQFPCGECLFGFALYSGSINSIKNVQFIRLEKPK